MHVSHLDDDYYIYIEDSLMLMGKHTRKRYRMGDRLEVKILAANPTQRQIDLIPAEMEMPETDSEEQVVPSKPPRKLKTPLEGGIDAELATGRRSASGAAARAGGAKSEAAAETAAEAKAPAKKRRGGRGRGAKQPAAAGEAADNGAQRSTKSQDRKPAPSKKQSDAASATEQEKVKRGKKRRRLVFG